MIQRLILGIDVGGTNIKFGVINSKGRIIARSNLVTRSYIRNKTKLIDALKSGIQDLLAGNNLHFSDLQGIGIGLPGLIDPPGGVVKFLPNIPGWKNVPLKKILQKKFRVPIFIENDVNLITLGEWRFGAGMGVTNMVCMTLGTGVGGGLILNNQLYRGQGYVAGEIGHMPLNEKGPGCNCGGKACFERYVGNRYLQRKILKVFKNKKLTLQDTGMLAARGDRKAVRFWEETAVHIGNALTGVVNLLNPTHIVIGGGVSNRPPFFFKTIEKTIKGRAMTVQAAMCKVVRAKLGDDAGIVGARVLVNENKGARTHV